MGNWSRRQRLVQEVRSIVSEKIEWSDADTLSLRVMRSLEKEMTFKELREYNTLSTYERATRLLGREGEDFTQALLELSAQFYIEMRTIIVRGMPPAIHIRRRIDHLMGPWGPRPA